MVPEVFYTFPFNFIRENSGEYSALPPDQALPIALDGRNMVGIGQTGSGKTLAFILPALAHIMNQRAAQRAAGREGDGEEQEAMSGRRRRTEYRGPMAVVLAPTRELAKQIEEVAAMYRRVCHIKTVCCIGGENR